MPSYAQLMLELAEHFDAGYYRACHPELSGSDQDLLRHYVTEGVGLGYDPSPYFSTTFYLKSNPDISASGLNPFWHFVHAGRAEGRVGLPEVREEMRALFDEAYYRMANPDVVAAKLDPFEHFVGNGWSEGRDPNPKFNMRYYIRAYKIPAGVNPLEHYIRSGRALGYAGNPESSTFGYCVHDDIRKFSNPSPDFYEARDTTIAAGKFPKAKAMALYLPQFYSFPENDAWWGKGFTEWRNVARGTPRFEGHYQPRIPEELGHYNLVESDTMRLQVEMAKAAGLEGFCFYYYWFNGKRVLDKPLDRFLEDKSLDTSFMLMWANENWTRRWDGFETDVLLRQDYSEEDEYDMLADWCRYFEDPRYLRVKGRPLFILYRPGIVPNAKETIARWRRRLKEEFGVEPWFFMTQAFGAVDPREFGLDGAMEFPPHKVAFGLPPITDQMNLTDLRFSGHVISYDQIVERASTTAVEPYPLMRGVMPSWDNDARRQGGGTVYHGSSPAKYEAWLGEAVEFARRNPFEGESIVFINAWNEWAEGAYLEPDVYYGSAYLNATARALTRSAVRQSKDKVVLFTHDAHRHGAQILVLHIAREMKLKFGVDVAIVSLGGGPLLDDYRALGPTYQVAPGNDTLDRALQELRELGFEHAILNTVVSGWTVPSLHRHGFFTVSLVHELPRLLREYRQEAVARNVAELSNLVVFAAKEVQDGFADVAGGLDEDKAIIRPQGSYLSWDWSPEESAALRQRLGVKDGHKLVLNVGYADPRKGVDIFLNTARMICAERDDVHFAWAGNMAPDVRNWLLADIDPASDFAKRFHLLPFTDELVNYYKAADLFFLSSREDPFPSVVLEAYRAGLPVVGLENSGGSVGIIGRFGGLAPRGDLARISAIITDFLDRPEARKAEEAAERQAYIENGFRFEDYVFDLLTMLRPGLGRVSVVVPNYNYASWLPARLDSIYDQTYPLYEVIVLDDCSPDNSLQVLQKYKDKTGHDFALLPNETNSGSGYCQWDKGAQLAKGDFVWIAEADDLAEPDFLDAAMRLLEDEDVAFVFCDSSQRDENDAPIADSYGYYFDTVEPGGLRADAVMEGEDFVSRYLSIKNLILNVSGVVWRKSALLAALDATREEHLVMKVACDWKMYAFAALREGKVGYVARSLNMHRRHSQSVTHSRKAEQHFGEITQVQDYVAALLGQAAARPDPRVEAYRQELRQAFGLDVARADHEGT